MSIRSEGPIDLGGAKLTTVGDPTAATDAATKGYVDSLSGAGAGGDIITGDTGQSAMLVAGNRSEVGFTTTTAQAVASTDVSNYRHVCVQVTSQGTSSTITFQGSNDNSNWQSVTLAPINTGAGAPASTATITGGWAGVCPYRYFRLNVTGITAGTTAGVVELYPLPAPPATATVSISGTPTVDTELPAAAALLDGVANPTTPLVGAALMSFNGTNWERARDDLAGADALPGNGILSSAVRLFNGSFYERRRTANAASNTTGIGVPATGLMGYDGSNWQRLKADTAGNLATGGANVEYTGTITNAGGVTGTAGTGIDARGYTRWILQLSGTYTGTPTIQYSNDNTNWYVADRYFLPGSGLGGYTNFISSGTNNIFSGPIVGRYLRISYNAFTSGTATYTLELSDTQSPYVYAQTPLPLASPLADVTANPNTTVVGSFPHIYGANSSWDRWKSISSVGSSMTTNTPGVAAVGVVGFDGTNTYRPLKVDSSQLLWVSVQGAVDTELPAAGAVLDGFANPTTPMVGVVGMVFNGASWDRQRAATSAAGTTGMGVLASGAMGFDGTNYQRAKSATDGTLVTMGRATTSALSSVAAATTTGISLLAADTTRRGAVIYNESTATLYLALGAGATTTAYSYQVPPGGTWEMPATCCYTGVVTGTWSTANGNARITSLIA